MTTTRLVRAGGRRGMRCLLAGSAVLLAVAGTAVASTTSAAASPLAAAASKALRPPPVVTEKPCVGKKAIGPFVASGAQVYSNGGKGHKGATIFRSYGPTVAFTLDAKKWNPTTTVDGDMDEMEMKWAADDWCANTVRLQVNQDLLFTTGGQVSTSYLDAILAEISYAESLKLVVVLNDSTESAVNHKTETMPTLTTFEFWEVMTALYGYGSGPNSGPAHVIFDLFNEPRAAGGSWQFWYNGQFAGFPPSPGLLYGMEPLAVWVRNILGAKNLFWIEGPNYSDSFAGMLPLYMIKTPSGAPMPNVVYAIHHPFAPFGKDNAQAWNAAFGYLIGQHLPVVEGEWTNFASGGSECWRDAIPAVANYLDAKPMSRTNGYLAAHGIGLSAYTLNSGRLLRQQYGIKKGKVVEIAPNPLQPTVITPATSTTVGYSCKASAYSVQAKTAGTEGFGQDAYNFFKAENQQA